MARRIFFASSGAEKGTFVPIRAQGLCMEGCGEIPGEGVECRFLHMAALLPLNSLGHYIEAGTDDKHQASPILWSSFSWSSRSACVALVAPFPGRRRRRKENR